MSVEQPPDGVSSIRQHDTGGLHQFIVIGVHRSGTSLLTETAIRLGLYGGEPADLDGADQWNSNGYWEHHGVRALNEELLSAADTDWFGGLAFESTRLPEELRVSLASRAAQIVVSLDAKAPWVVKDPRMCVLLPFWRPFLSSSGFLFSLRNPLAVARSIRNRVGFPVSVGLALWEAQLLAALESTKGSPRVDFWYENLVARPLEEAARLASWLRQATEGAAGTAGPSSAVDHRLHHNVIDPAEEGALPCGALRLLGALRSGEAFDDAFDTSLSGDARELIEFVDQEERTRRFLESGWRQQRAAQGEAIHTLEEMIRLKDEYIDDLKRHIDRDP